MARPRMTPSSSMLPDESRTPIQNFIFLKWGFIGATRVAKNGNKVAESLPMMRLML